MTGEAAKPAAGLRAPGGAFVPPAALAMLAAVLAAVLFAPERSNFAWAWNGLRGAGPVTWGGLALGAGVLAAWALGAPLPIVSIALFAVLVLVGPWHEVGNFLGDTFVRQRALDLAERGGAVAPFGEFGRLMHAQPLDDLLGVWGPATLARQGIHVAWTQAIVSGALVLAWWWIASRTVRRLAGEGAPSALAVALVVGGSLEVFTRYAESGGVLLVFGALWWLVLLGPIDSLRRAALGVLAWFAFAFAHRVALVAVVPQLLRAFVLRREDDDTRARLALGAGTLVAFVAGAFASGDRVHGALAQDFAELLAGAHRITPLHDLFGLLVVAAPLACLAPAVAGVRRLREVLDSPLGRLHVVTFLALSPLLLVFPMAPHGLGPHRDWELAILPGWILTTFMAAALAKLEPARLRGALAALLPALLLLAGAWLAPHANAEATFERAVTFVDAPGGARGEARAHACVYLGYRCADAGDDRASATWFDRSFALLANPRTSLLAAESWLRAGEPDSAARSLALTRAAGPLPPGLEKVAGELQRAIAEVSGTPFRNAGR